MSAASNYLENAIVDHILGTSAFTMPTGVYVQLHTGNPGEDGTANVATNSTRKLVTFGAASGGVALNDSLVSWSPVGADETYTHYSLWDALTGGNPLYAVNTLDANVPVLSANDFEFPVGSLSQSAA